MKTFFLILCAALLLGTVLSVKPAEPAEPAAPQNPRFSLFEPIVFYPFVVARAYVVTVVTTIYAFLQCVFEYFKGANPSLATTYGTFNSTAISCMNTINDVQPFDPASSPPSSQMPTLDEMCNKDDSGRIFDSTSKDIAFDGVEQTYYYISGEMNMFAGYRADDPYYAFNSPQFRPPTPPTAPADMPYASTKTGETNCSTVTLVSIYYQAAYFIEFGKVLKQNAIDVHNDIQEIKNTTGIDCPCTDTSPTIKQITDEIEAINVAMVYNQYYYYSTAAMITVSSSALITKMDTSIKRCQDLVTKLRDSHVKINTEIKSNNDKSYKKLKEDKKSKAISDDKYSEGVRKQNTNSRKHGRKHVHNGFRKHRRERENKEKNVKKARKTMVENWKKTVSYYETSTIYINDYYQIVKPKLTTLSAKFKNISNDLDRIFSARQKKCDQVEKESNDSYIFHSDKHHREHERCTEIIIKDNSNSEICQDVLDKIQDYTLSFDVEARKCHENAFKIIDEVPDNSEVATQKIGEMLQSITKGVDKCMADTNALSAYAVNWLPIWTRTICADCLDKMITEATSFTSKAEVLCKEEIDNSTVSTAINSSKQCHQNKSNKLTQFTVAFELEITKCKVIVPTTPSGSTTPSSTTVSSTTKSSTTGSSTTGSSTTGSSTTGVSTTVSSTTVSSTTKSSTTGSSTTGSSTTGSSTTGSSTTGSSTTGSSTTGVSTTGSSTTGSSTTGSSTTGSSTTGSSTTGSSTTGSSTTGSSTTGSSTTPSSTTGSSTTPSSTTGSSTTGSSTTGSSTTGSSTTGSSTTGSSTTGSSTTGSSTTGSSTAGSSTTGSSTTGSSTTSSSTTGSSTTGSSTTGSSTSGSSATGSSTSMPSTSGSSTTESSTTGSSTTGSSTTGSSATESSTTGSSATESTTTGSITTGAPFCQLGH